MDKKELLEIFNLYVLQENFKKGFNTNYLGIEIPNRDLEIILINNFTDIASLILSNPNYGIFLKCAEKYPNEYAKYFFSNKNSKINYNLSNFLGNLFCKYKTTKFIEVYDYYSYDNDKNPLNVEMMKLNYLLALQKFDLDQLNRIIAMALNLYDTYTKEIPIYENDTILETIDVFSKVCTKQSKLNILNGLRESFKSIKLESDKPLVLKLLEDLQLYIINNDSIYIDEIDSLIIEFKYLFKM